MQENIKTAVSLRRGLFEQGEELAGKMQISRSRLFALALEEFIRRRQNQELLDRINAAYRDGPDQSERALQENMRRQHRRLLKSHP